MDSTEPTLNVLGCVNRHKEGYSKDYDTVVKLLQDNDTAEKTKVVILKQLRSCISEIGDNSCDALVTSLLRMSWLHESKGLADNYQSVMINLVSAYPVLVRAVLKMLVKLFTPPDSKATQGSRVTDGEEAAFERLHRIVSKILKLTPMSVNVLMQLLQDHCPYVGRAVHAHVCYTHNLLQVTRYQPSLRPRVLRLVVDRLIQMDVAAPREAILDTMEDDNDSDSDSDIFQMEEEDGIPPAGVKHPMACKLDALMDIVLAHVKAVCHPQGVYSWEEARPLYKELLGVFDSLILPTHNSCHVQFIMLVVCSYHQALAEGFMDYLWKKVRDPNVQPVFRQTAASYLGGLLARADYVSLETLTTSLELQAGWCHRYIQQAQTAPELTLHAPFYALCQALFYAVIFTHKLVLKSATGQKVLMSLNLQGIVTSRLNPLKHCQSAVVKTFASIARQHQVAYCDTVLSHNERCRLPVAATSDYSALAPPALEPFFPFDPYLLPRSNFHVAGLYREFDGQPVLEPSDDRDYESDGMEYLEEKEEGKLQPIEKYMLSGSLGKSPRDLILHGTSPGFSLLDHMDL